ncbi:Ubiquitin fusion degradation protein UFD1 [Moelleriella libera RCEF 2490]|uniref:Ubiquitin fusion degradation protein UFD1 n=1 Tax=Moelleriella libera RCEF 2490 TaxID=1081109 RepID=A0A162IKG5_9HYPO|nr:Ubiquitin fusion degradation protein UFD1 [Moelleriella libera RCEF 2490]
MTEQVALRWSGSFRVLPLEGFTPKILTGDKIILPQSALEQLLAVAQTSSFDSLEGPNFHRSNGYASGFQQQQLPQPLTFRLVNRENGNVIYAGIREFSSEEGTAKLSPWLLEALGIDAKRLTRENGNDLPDASLSSATRDPMPLDSAHITIHATAPPKGTYVRLRPLEAGYNPDDWKSLLERHLRDNFTCLTKNSVLAVNGVRGEEFKFLVDKLSPEGESICIVDTDLEVDIEALNEDQARETMQAIMNETRNEASGGDSNGGSLDIWKDVAGTVLPGGYVDFVLPSWDRSQILTVTLSDIEGEEGLDLFVTPRSSRQRSLPREATHVFGDFSPAENGTKTISIQPSNVEMDGAESIMISVHASNFSQANAHDSLSFKIRSRIASQISRHEVNGMGSGNPGHNADERQCRNCRQWVPQRTMVLHENFCRRNNVACQQCDAVFKKDSEEWNSHWHCGHDSAKGNSTASKSKHDWVFHQDRQCQDCAFTTNSLADLARHRTSVCPGKLILCRFCHLEVPQEGDPFEPSPEVVLSGLTAHELADGARTTECHLCEKIVRLRDMETHLKHHELDKISREKPPLCGNANCGRTLHGVGPRGQIRTAMSQDQGTGNNIGLCSICFGPLYVSMHDPDDKALRRRIERRYLGQLMKGCGKSHCTNEWCKTGRATLSLEAKGSSASAALPLVKPLVAMAGDPQGHMYFCVDDMNQKRRSMAELIAAEKVWDLEWCVAAAEAENASLDKMREWLQAWAPRR